MVPFVCLAGVNADMSSIQSQVRHYIPENPLIEKDEMEAVHEDALLDVYAADTEKDSESELENNSARNQKFSHHDSLWLGLECLSKGCKAAGEAVSTNVAGLLLLHIWSVPSLSTIIHVSKRV